MINTPDRFDLRAPCASCPFRTDGEPVLLSHDRRAEIAAAIANDGTFLCHENIDYEEDDETGDDRAVGGAQCAGASLTAGPPQLLRIAMAFPGGLASEPRIPEPIAGIPWESAWDWAENMPGWDD